MAALPVHIDDDEWQYEESTIASSKTEEPGDNHFNSTDFSSYINCKSLSDVDQNISDNGIEAAGNLETDEHKVEAKSDDDSETGEAVGNDVSMNGESNIVEAMEESIECAEKGITNEESTNEDILMHTSLVESLLKKSASTNNEVPTDNLKDVLPTSKEIEKELFTLCERYGVNYNPPCRTELRGTYKYYTALRRRKLSFRLAKVKYLSSDKSRNLTTMPNLHFQELCTIFETTYQDLGPCEFEYLRKEDKAWNKKLREEMADEIGTVFLGMIIADIGKNEHLISDDYNGLFSFDSSILSPDVKNKSQTRPAKPRSTKSDLVMPCYEEDMEGDVSVPEQALDDTSSQSSISMSELKVTLKRRLNDQLKSPKRDPHYLYNRTEQKLMDECNKFGVQYKLPSQREIEKNKYSDYRRHMVCFRLARAQHFGTTVSHLENGMPDEHFKFLCDKLGLCYQSPDNNLLMNDNELNFSPLPSDNKKRHTRMAVSIGSAYLKHMLSGDTEGSKYSQAKKKFRQRTPIPLSAIGTEEDIDSNYANDYATGETTCKTPTEDKIMKILADCHREDTYEMDERYKMPSFSIKTGLVSTGTEEKLREECSTLGVEYEEPDLTELEINKYSNYRQHMICFKLARSKHLDVTVSQLEEPMSEDNFKYLCDAFDTSYEEPFRDHCVSVDSQEAGIDQERHTRMALNIGSALLNLMISFRTIEPDFFDEEINDNCTDVGYYEGGNIHDMAYTSADIPQKEEELSLTDAYLYNECLQNDIEFTAPGFKELHEPNTSQRKAMRKQRVMKIFFQIACKKLLNTPNTTKYTINSMSEDDYIQLCEVYGVNYQGPSSEEINGSKDVHRIACKSRRNALTYTLSKAIFYQLGQKTEDRNNQTEGDMETAIDKNESLCIPDTNDTEKLSCESMILSDEFLKNECFKYNMQFISPGFKELQGTNKCMTEVRKQRAMKILFQIACSKHLNKPECERFTIGNMSEDEFYALCEIYAVPYQYPASDEVNASRDVRKLKCNSRRTALTRAISKGVYLQYVPEAKVSLKNKKKVKSNVVSPNAVTEKGCTKSQIDSQISHLFHHCHAGTTLPLDTTVTYNSYRKNENPAHSNKLTNCLTGKYVSEEKQMADLLDQSTENIIQEVCHMLNVEWTPPRERELLTNNCSTRSTRRNSICYRLARSKYIESDPIPTQGTSIEHEFQFLCKQLGVEYMPPTTSSNANRKAHQRMSNRIGRAFLIYIKSCKNLTDINTTVLKAPDNTNAQENTDNCKVLEDNHQNFQQKQNNPLTEDTIKSRCDMYCIPYIKPSYIENYGAKKQHRNKLKARRYSEMERAITFEKFCKLIGKMTERTLKRTCRRYSTPYIPPCMYERSRVYGRYRYTARKSRMKKCLFYVACEKYLNRPHNIRCLDFILTADDYQRLCNVYEVEYCPPSSQDSENSPDKKKTRFCSWSQSMKGNIAESLYCKYESRAKIRATKHNHSHIRNFNTSKCTASAGASQLKERQAYDKSYKLQLVDDQQNVYDNGIGTNFSATEHGGEDHSKSKGNIGNGTMLDSSLCTNNIVGDFKPSTPSSNHISYQGNSKSSCTPYFNSKSKSNSFISSEIHTPIANKMEYSTDVHNNYPPGSPFLGLDSDQAPALISSHNECIESNHIQQQNQTSSDNTAPFRPVSMFMHNFDMHPP